MTRRSLFGRPPAPAPPVPPPATEPRIETAPAARPGSAASPFSIREISARIREVLEDGFARSFWIEGELSQVSRPQSGHLYLSFREERVVLEAVAWASDARSFAFVPEPGDRIRAFGRLRTYDGKSVYQFQVQRLEKAGIGALLQELQEREARLEREGLFDPARKRDLPFLPLRIGLLTAAGSDASVDFTRTARTRFPGVRIREHHAPVQGPAAPRGAGRRDPGAGPPGARRHRGGPGRRFGGGPPPLQRRARGARGRRLSRAARERDRPRGEPAAPRPRGGPPRQHSLGGRPRHPPPAGGPGPGDRGAPGSGGDHRAARPPGGGRPGGDVPDPPGDGGAPRLAPSGTAEPATGSVHGARGGPERHRDREVRLRAARERLEQSHPRRRLAEQVTQLHRLRERLAGLPLLRGPEARLEAAAPDLSGTAPPARGGGTRRAGRAAAPNRTPRSGGCWSAAPSPPSAVGRKLGDLDPRVVLRRGYSLALDSEGRALASSRDVRVGDRLRLLLGEGELGAAVEEVRPPDATTRLPRARITEGNES